MPLGDWLKPQDIGNSSESRSTGYRQCQYFLLESTLSSVRSGRFSVCSCLSIMRHQQTAAAAAAAAAVSSEVFSVVVTYLFLFCRHQRNSRQLNDSLSTANHSSSEKTIKKPKIWLEYSFNYSLQIQGKISQLSLELNPSVRVHIFRCEYVNL